MNISKRYIIIGGAIAAAVLITIVVTVVVLVSKKGATSEIFKTCDGLSHPIGNFNISSCPDIAKVGYCTIDTRFTIWFDVEFTLDKEYDKLDYVVTGPIDSYFLNNVCDYATITCPVKAGRKQKMEIFFGPGSFKRNGFGQIKFKLLPPDEEIYCVEFPALIY